MKKLEGKWLVAVSGGPDSMALLHICIQLKMDISCAHVNYHHRNEADEEESYVRAFCKENDIPCFVRNEPFEYHGNFEACARDWRYEFFQKCIVENQLKGVLIAHQEDDLIETYLMQEKKGIVPNYYGLKEENMYHGMLVVRPLLEYTKLDLENYCKQHHVKYYIDCTNEDETYSRNAIRKEVVSKMTSFERKMFRKEIALKNAQKQERTCRVNTYIHESKMSLKQYRLCSKEDRMAILRIIMDPKYYSISNGFMDEIDTILCTKNDFIIDIKDKILVQDHGTFFLTEKIQPYSYIYHSEAELKQANERCFKSVEGKCGVQAVTLREDDYPVTIRSFVDGDAIQLRLGKKKVLRFFIDRKIPKYLRNTWPIIVNSKGNVVLVPMIGCDINHYTDKPTLNVVQYPLTKENF